MVTSTSSNSRIILHISAFLPATFFVTKVAEHVGLPVPAVEIVELDAWLVEHRSELSLQLSNQVVPCTPGLQFGSRHVIDQLLGQVLDVDRQRS
jgi:hypothetical protein